MKLNMLSEAKHILSDAPKGLDGERSEDLGEIPVVMWLVHNG